jgi:ElaB/YqjD/DUF883 family membrane-anchored ribosome-binding protein
MSDIEDRLRRASANLADNLARSRALRQRAVAQLERSMATLLDIQDTVQSTRHTVQHADTSVYMVQWHLGVGRKLLQSRQPHGPLDPEPSG